MGLIFYTNYCDLWTNRLAGQTAFLFCTESLSIFFIFLSTEKHGWENVNLLNLALCKSLPRITHFSSFCKPLLRLKLNSSPNKLGFVKCQLSNHRRLRSIQVLIASRSCQTHNDYWVSTNQTFPFSQGQKYFADDDTKCVLFTALIFFVFCILIWLDHLCIWISSRSVADLAQVQSPKSPSQFEASTLNFKTWRKKSRQCMKVTRSLSNKWWICCNFYISWNFSNFQIFSCTCHLLIPMVHLVYGMVYLMFGMVCFMIFLLLYFVFAMAPSTCGCLYKWSRVWSSSCAGFYHIWMHNSSVIII